MTRIDRLRPRHAYRLPEPHRTYRRGDEWACSCGKCWPVGEAHP